MATKQNSVSNKGTKKNTTKTNKSNGLKKENNTTTKKVSNKKTVSKKSTTKLTENNKNIVARVEDEKIEKKVNKKLLGIGIFISLLGIICLVLTIIANRTIDRNYINDVSIIVMSIVSIIIEICGASIIIVES